jgi:hypothetical protein
VSFKPQPLEPQYTLNKTLGGPQSWFAFCGEKKHLLLLMGIEPRFLGQPIALAI